MINNLFSRFDPSIRLISINWLSVLLPLIAVIITKFKKNNKITIIRNLMLSHLIKEIKALTQSNPTRGTIKILTITFSLIFVINIISLTPFTFTPTAHIIITFPTALSIWLSIIIFGWANNTNKILSHIVPTRTPLALINFIVLIETVSNIIRPITLSIRLSANIVAGHILLNLLRNFALNSNDKIILSYPILIILFILEIAVAFIQAYVFITLIRLYTTEIH